MSEPQGPATAQTMTRAAPARALPLTPTTQELMAVFDIKYRQQPQLGLGPKTRLRFGYFNPDDHYEAIVSRLLQPGDSWADVGCGRDIFPSNRPLARELTSRSGYVFGIDPDPNIRANELISERFEGLVEDCTTTHRFDLITLRMVAEHIVEPAHSMAKIAELLKPGGLAVIYTPNKRSPVPLVTRLVPNKHHHFFKRMLWDGQARDTFPTAFKLNTRQALAGHCGSAGLTEVYFTYLDDCRTFDAYHWLNVAELALQKTLRSLGVRYPENCLLGVYRKG